MTSENKRVVVLAGVMAVIGAIVVVDRMGGDDVAGEVSESGARGAYLSEASLYEQTAAVAEMRREWEASHVGALRAWEERKEKMIAAPSGEIAAARLRGLVEQVLLDEGLSITTSETLPIGRGDSDSPVVGIGLSFSFEASEAAPVYRVLDRIEHLPDAVTRVEAITLRGPGRLGGAGALQATLRLRAVALIEGDGRG